MLKTVERTFPKITEQGLDELRQRIGVQIGVTAEPWCYEATRDNIRHYAHGIGDDNPLWCAPEYAAKTKFGDVIALPSFLFSTSRIVSGYVGGLPGVHAMWSGADWTWHKAVRRNDAISTEAHLKDIIEHETRFAGRAVQQIYHVDFFNQQGDLRRRGRQLVFPHRARPRARAGHEVQGGQGPRAAPLQRGGAGRGLQALRRRADPRRDPALLAGRQRRRGAADHAEGADDGHGLHRLRARLGRPLHPRQQARLEAGRRASGPRHRQPLRHSRLPRAGALGGGVRARGRRARRLRLRPGALLLAHPPYDQLDGRRRFPARARPARSAGTIRKATSCSSRAR